MHKRFQQNCRGLWCVVLMRNSIPVTFSFSLSLVDICVFETDLLTLRIISLFECGWMCLPIRVLIRRYSTHNLYMCTLAIYSRMSISRTASDPTPNSPTSTPSVQIVCLGLFNGRIYAVSMCMCVCVCLSERSGYELKTSGFSLDKEQFKWLPKWHTS